MADEKVLDELKKYTGEEVGVIYKWRGIGWNGDPSKIENQGGILKEVNSEEVYIEFTGIKPIVDPFGRIIGHRIPFKGEIGTVHKIFSKDGKVIYGESSNYNS